MSGYSLSSEENTLFSIENFEIRTLDDEIRVDDLCKRLLKLFFLDLTEQGQPGEQAGVLAWGADYFLREFVVPDRQENIFALRPERVRQFAGHWYIVRNMEPNMAELDGILAGVQAFYEYAGRIGKVSAEVVEDVRSECADRDFYRQRIDDFWAIEGDGFLAWQRACPLEK